jgi:hypothetical protein
LLTAPVRTSRQERWLAEVMRFMPDIHYVKGSDNVVADALSRRVDLAAMHVSSVVASSLVHEISMLSAADPTVVKLVDEGTLVFRETIPYTVKTGTSGGHRSAQLSETFAGHVMPVNETRDLELYLMAYYSLFPFLMVLGRVSL